MEANTKTRTDSVAFMIDDVQLALITREYSPIPSAWVVEVEFLNAVIVVKGPLTDHFRDGSAERLDLKDDLGSNSSLIPLLVGSPVPLRASKNNQDIRCNAKTGNTTLLFFY